MATVSVCSDFGTQENKVCHCFHCFPQILKPLKLVKQENFHDLGIVKDFIDKTSKIINKQNSKIDHQQSFESHYLKKKKKVKTVEKYKHYTYLTKFLFKKNVWIS